jgi:anti-sigma-K factor RskA
MNEREFSELSAAAALNALSPDDERRLQEALIAHPEWQDAARADADIVGALSASIAPVTPPTSVRDALLARISVTPQFEDSAADDAADPVDVSVPDDTSALFEDSSAEAGESTPDVARSEAAPRPRRPLRVLFALAACLALLVGVGVGAVALNGYLNRPASVVALEQIEGATDAQQASVDVGSGGTATAHWSASLGSAVLVTDGIAAPADDRTYELWFVRGDQAISAGTFDVDGGDATAQLSGDMHEGDVIAVTVEQAGGSPDGVPTSDPVIIIPTA